MEKSQPVELVCDRFAELAAVDVCCVGIEDEIEVAIVLEMLEEVAVWFAYPTASLSELRTTPEWSRLQFS